MTASSTETAATGERSAARSFRHLGADQALAFLFDAFEHDRPYTLFDTRDDDSYSRGHMPSAQTLKERDIGEWVARLPRAQPLLIYCYHGNASQTYAQTFADFGFQEVYSIDGGFHELAHAWQHAREAAMAAKPQPSQALQDFLGEQGFPIDDIHATTGAGVTPLMRAARFARLELIDELLALGAGLETRNADGNTALWLACYSDDAAIVQRFIDAGAMLDNQNDNGATCLMYAASNGRAHLVELLLKAGADAMLKNLDDFRAVDLASSIECLRLLRHTA